jgi:hypothetical protein
MDGSEHTDNCNVQFAAKLDAIQTEFESEKSFDLRKLFDMPEK